MFDRFLEKGYSPCELNKTLAVVRGTDRDDLFKKKVADNRDFGISFMTGFTRQYKQVEKVIRKYWHLLLKDNDLAKVLPNKPQYLHQTPHFTFEIGTQRFSIRLRKHVPFLIRWVFFSCGRYVMCKTSKHRVRKTMDFTSHASGESFKINKFTTCGMTHVTYLLSCPCGLQYVGRTTRALGVRLREHVNRI